MLATKETVLEMEDVSMARVRCVRCGEQIGHLRIVVPEGIKSAAWKKKVRRELALLDDEHELLCQARNNVTR